MTAIIAANVLASLLGCGIAVALALPIDYGSLSIATSSFGVSLYVHSCQIVGGIV